VHFAHQSHVTHPLSFLTCWPFAPTATLLLKHQSSLFWNFFFLFRFLIWNSAL
jgi:hypothetical protein